MVEALLAARLPVFLLAGATLFMTASCSGGGHSDSARTPGPRTTSPSPAVSVVSPGDSPPAPSPDSTTGAQWVNCLKSHGLIVTGRLPRQDPDGHIRLAVEACASQVTPGRWLRIPVVKGDRFQACLSSHGVKLPSTGTYLHLDTGSQPIAAAIKTCSP